VLAREGHRLLAVACLGHHLVPRALEQVAQVEADDRLVFGDQDAHGVYARTMLQIDDAAVAALEQIGTIRISAEEVGDETEISIDEATEPHQGDEVLETDGAKVFLAPSAVEVLADQVLGVHAHGDHFHFTFDDQPA
jgi:Fe-S cluster assembly iron-binding protein IscA